MNLVSVILPFYNAEDLLVKTIQSIIGQTYSHIELIMIDDGSTDQSQQVARSYTHLSNVKLLIQENEGAAVARNTGLKAASGIFIQFMDAGDIITADKIQQQVEDIRDDMHKVAVCNYVMFSNEADLQSDHFPDQSSFIYTTNETQDFLINLWGGYGRRNFIQTNSWLIPRNLIERAGGWRPYRCPDDDGEFFSRILLASSGI
ncbi:MAG: glycosyltransferase family 2 protein, partial [Bacteroidota bacterium]